MARETSLFRSVLYIPATNERAMQKAKSLPCDAIIFDLEDAVAPDEKPRARGVLARILAGGGYGDRALIVRINAPDTPWGRDDILACVDAGAGAILLPKVQAAADIETVARMLDRIPNAAHIRIWAMMETPLSILNAAQIAAAPRLAGVVMGTNDLAKDITARTPAAMMAARQICVLAAKAHGVICIDGVYNAFKDIEGLTKECLEGRDFGFDGKSLIHPAQIAPANDIFAPSSDDIALAHRQIAAFDAALAAGQGVAVLEGRIVEQLHVETARRIVAQADVIAKKES
jgi:(3S)-malyl-CoA thioesterase